MTCVCLSLSVCVQRGAALHRRSDFCSWKASMHCTAEGMTRRKHIGTAPAGGAILCCIHR